MIKESEHEIEETQSNIALNWFEELKRRLAEGVRP